MPGAGSLDEFLTSEFALLGSGAKAPALGATTAQTRARVIIRALPKWAVLPADDGQLGFRAFVNATRVVVAASMHCPRSPNE